MLLNHVLLGVLRDYSLSSGISLVAQYFHNQVYKVNRSIVFYFITNQWLQYYCMVNCFRKSVTSSVVQDLHEVEGTLLQMEATAKKVAEVVKAVLLLPVIEPQQLNAVNGTLPCGIYKGNLLNNIKGNKSHGFGPVRRGTKHNQGDFLECSWKCLWAYACIKATLYSNIKTSPVLI